MYSVQPSSDILNDPSQQDLAQFILDYTSPNLNNNIRVFISSQKQPHYDFPIPQVLQYFYNI